MTTIRATATVRQRDPVTVTATIRKPSSTNVQTTVTARPTTTTSLTVNTPPSTNVSVTATQRPVGIVNFELHTTEHDKLSHRDYADQHPITAITGLREELDQLDPSGALEVERQARIAADTQLQANINSESSARAGADETLQTNITNEATLRANADTVLGSAITNEEQARIAAITAEATTRANDDLLLNEGILNEQDARIDEDARLDAEITSTQTGLSNEVTARANADTTLQTNITNEANLRANKDTELNDLISAEVARATAKEDSLEGSLATETSNRTSADQVLTSAINAEVTRATQAESTEATTRANADTALSNRINNIVVDVTAQIEAEATAREEADETLQSNIDAEATTRSTTDTALQNSITAEATARANADSALDTRVTANTNRFSNYRTQLGQDAIDTALRQSITAEATTRASADTNLQEQIDAIVSKSDVVDIVGTYQELVTYDTSKLHNKDIVKVLSDSTHNNAPSYYRWMIVEGGTNHWDYIGSEAVAYTKSESDSRYAYKTITVNGQSLANNVVLDATDVLTPTQQTAVNSGITSTLTDQITTNQTNIANETATRSQETTQLRSDLTTESTTRANADTNLQNQLSALRYGKQLEYNNPTLALKDQLGNVLNTVTIKSTPDTDGTTINLNSDNELQAIGVIEKNTLTAKYDWIGTTAQYTTQQIATLHPDWICFITDDAHDNYINWSYIIDKPVNVSQFTNDAGYLTSITATLIRMALGYTPYSSDNPSRYQTYTQLVNYAMPNTMLFGKTLAVQNSYLLLKDQNGNTLSYVPFSGGGGGGSPADNLSITLNSESKIQTVGVIDQNSPTTALKQWSGTRVQYDAIEEKDSDTMYNITDDVTGVNAYTKSETDTLLSQKQNNLPTQTGQSGKFLTTNGTTLSWGSVDALPAQSGQSGKFLTTDGSSASWANAVTTSSANTFTTTNTFNGKTILKNTVELGDSSSVLGSLEFYGGNQDYGGFIDFHYKNSTADYTSRIIEDESGKINFSVSGLKYNGKTMRFVVEEYKSGASWYRKWSDGWIEQGGHSDSSGSQTITFPTPFTTTNYQITSSGTVFYLGTAKTTTTFTMSGSAWGTAVVAYCDWCAYGY